MITIHIAVEGFDSHCWYESISPVWVSRAFRAPYSALSIQRHMSALTIVGSAHGRMTSERRSQRSRSGWSMRRARAIPSTSSIAVEATVKTRERQTAAQKSGLASSLA